MTVHFDASAPPAPTRDAATVLLCREGAEGLELFFVKRAADVRFMGGAYVFPGGKLDPEDAEPSLPGDLDGASCAAALGEPDPSRARALYVAAARECLEESGVALTAERAHGDTLRAALEAGRGLREVLAESGHTLALSRLLPFARWVTPKAETRRFDARFFLTRVPADTQARHDEGETVASVWLSPARALERARAGEIVLVPPTWRTVELLSRARTAEEALAFAPEGVPLPVEPEVHFGEGTIDVVLPGDPRSGASASLALRGGPFDLRTLVCAFRYEDGVWRALPPPAEG